jgi:hypothetical protein
MDRNAEQALQKVVEMVCVQRKFKPAESVQW